MICQPTSLRFPDFLPEGLQGKSTRMSKLVDKGAAPFFKTKKKLSLAFLKKYFELVLKNVKVNHNTQYLKNIDDNV